MENETVKTDGLISNNHFTSHPDVVPVETKPETAESSPVEKIETAEVNAEVKEGSEVGEKVETEVKSEKVEVKEENSKGKKSEDEKPQWLKDIQRERQRRRDLEAKVAELEGKLSSPSQDDFKAIASELGIPEEDAKKLDAILERKLNKQKDRQTVQSKEVQKLEQSFINEVSEIRSDYQDWDEMGESMQKAFVDEVSRINEAGGNPLDAFRKGPEFFYYKAKASKVDSASKAHVQGKKEMADKINQKNMASVESSKSSGGKPTPKSGWTREKISNLSPADYAKHRDEINAALLSGAIQ